MSGRRSMAGAVALAAASLGGLAIALLGAFGAGPAAARELALVVGIDEYRFGSDRGAPDTVRNLEGAANDARLIAATLRGLGAELPEARVLIGPDATAAAFRAAWEELLEEAGPGDGIVVTFAGHGGRETEVGVPFDEDDGHDETLMFWDFDPLRPHVGRIVDDELFAMLGRAGGRRVTFVADACHSGGLTRSFDRTVGRSRQGGTWDFDEEVVEAMPSADDVGDELLETLENVAYLTATADESKVILEILHEERPHGALSVGFAEGIVGAADADGDGLILRRELEEYVGYRVGTLSSRLQVPGFEPRGGAPGEPLLSLDVAILATPAADPDALAFAAVGAVPPTGLDGARRTETGAALQFERRGDEMVVHHGVDEIVRFDADAGAGPWQAVVDRFRLLEAVDAAYDRTAGPPEIALGCEAGTGADGGENATVCDDRHREGDRIRFLVDRPREGGGHLTVFNLAGAGEVQPLYPDASYDDPSAPRALPFELETDVGPPFGRDDLVAGFCRDEPEALRALIGARDGRSAPSPERFVSLSAEYGCQWGRYPLFTGP